MGFNFIWRLWGPDSKEWVITGMFYSSTAGLFQRWKFFWTKRVQQSRATSDCNIKFWLGQMYEDVFLVGEINIWKRYLWAARDPLLRRMDATESDPMNRSYIFITLNEHSVGILGADAFPDAFVVDEVATKRWNIPWILKRGESHRKSEVYRVVWGGPSGNQWRRFEGCVRWLWQRMIYLCTLLTST